MAILEVGALASHFTLLGLDGCEYSLPRSLGGKPALLVFFTTGCPTCDLAFPYVNRLRETYPEGWELWAVSQDPPDRSSAYARKYGITYPVLLDAPEFSASKPYDPPSTPTMYLIDAHGRVEFTTEGFSKHDLNEIAARIASHVGAEATVIAPDNDGNPDMRPGCWAKHARPVRHS
jgi:peroxiredoxin